MVLIRNSIKERARKGSGQEEVNKLEEEGERTKHWRWAKRTKHMSAMNKSMTVGLATKHALAVAADKAEVIDAEQRFGMNRTNEYTCKYRD